MNEEQNIIVGKVFQLRGDPKVFEWIEIFASRIVQHGDSIFIKEGKGTEALQLFYEKAIEIFGQFGGGDEDGTGNSASGAMKEEDITTDFYNASIELLVFATLELPHLVTPDDTSHRKLGQNSPNSG